MVPPGICTSLLQVKKSALKATGVFLVTIRIGDIDTWSNLSHQRSARNYVRIVRHHLPRGFCWPWPWALSKTFCSLGHTTLQRSEGSEIVSHRLDLLCLNLLGSVFHHLIRCLYSSHFPESAEAWGLAGSFVFFQRDSGISLCPASVNKLCWRCQPPGTWKHVLCLHPWRTRKQRFLSLNLTSGSVVLRCSAQPQDVGCHWSFPEVWQFCLAIKKSLPRWWII